MTLIEVIVVVVIIGLALLFLLLMLPQGGNRPACSAARRTWARSAVALAIYDQNHRQLPDRYAALRRRRPGTTRWPGPLRTLLETLQLPDLTELQDPESPRRPRPGRFRARSRVPGFVCSSDPNATAGWFAAPISYRATTGDTPAGDDGPFAIGRVLRLQDVEAADGLSYTAAFLGTARGRQSTEPRGDRQLSGRSRPARRLGMPGDRRWAGWRGDAGSSWSWSDYRHTLYNHALPPTAHQSCVAADGKTALHGRVPAATSAASTCCSLTAASPWSREKSISRSGKSSPGSISSPWSVVRWR